MGERLIPSLFLLPHHVEHENGAAQAQKLDQ